jgi:death-on-curing protein
MKGPRRFLSVEDVLLIHADTFRHEGGMDGLRDHGLLESAVMMPRQQFGGAYLHRTLAEQAGAYLFHLCCNHPFNDGNKRVSALATLVFLQANGVESLPDPVPLEDVTMRCAAGSIGKQDVIAFFRQHLRVTSGRTARRPAGAQRRKVTRRRKKP